MNLMDIMVGDTNQRRKVRDRDNVVLIDVSYYAQRAFHGFFRGGEVVTHISMRYTLLTTLLWRLKQLNIHPSTHEIVMCYDGRKYWRRVLAPYYKCRRRDKRDDNKDWDGYNKYMKSLREELEEFYPFIIMYLNDIKWKDECGNIHFNGLEADDIIGVLAYHLGKLNKNVIIMSGDSDFTQLDYFDNIKIYNYDSEIVEAEHGCGAFDLIYKIVNGDSKDDIANILSRSNYWENRMDGERQKSAKSIAKEMCSSINPLSILNEDQLKRYKENEKLIDFKYIPKEFQLEIMKEYASYEVNNPNRLYDLLYKVESDDDDVIQENLEKLILELI